MDKFVPDDGRRNMLDTHCTAQNAKTENKPETTIWPTCRRKSTIIIHGLLRPNCRLRISLLGKLLFFSIKSASSALLCWRKTCRKRFITTLLACPDIAAVE
jgi:hypothetical protein